MTESYGDFYTFLGVSKNASIEEIKRAFTRKRREFQNNEAATTKLNKAYAILCDPQERKRYDINLQYGDVIEHIEQKITNSTNEEERQKYLLEARNLYVNILKQDSENQDILWYLVNIEEALGNQKAMFFYIEKLEKCLVNIKNDTEKVQMWHKLAEKYQTYEKIEEAIKLYQNIYEIDKTLTNDIITLARLYYEDKKQLKIAIQILNDCINKSNNNKAKIKYLCECLRAIHSTENTSHPKLEETLYKMLYSLSLKTAKENPDYAEIILKAIFDAIDREDLTSFHQLEKIFLNYKLDNDKLNNTFKAIQQFATAIENGKVHKAILLWFSNWTENIRQKLGEYLLSDIDDIKSSIEYLKKKAPLYYSYQKEEIDDFEKYIDKKLTLIKEYQSLIKNKAISNNMKKILQMLILLGIFSFDEIKNELENSVDNFFEKEDKEKVQYTLSRIKEYYPNCYELISKVFFKEQKTNNTFKNQPFKNNIIDDNQKLNSEWFWKFIGGIIASIIFLANPILGSIIFIIIYYYSKKTEISKSEEKKEKILSNENILEKSSEIIQTIKKWKKYSNENISEKLSKIIKTIVITIVIYILLICCLSQVA